MYLILLEIGFDIHCEFESHVIIKSGYLLTKETLLCLELKLSNSNRQGDRMPVKNCVQNFYVRGVEWKKL